MNETDVWCQVDSKQSHKSSRFMHLRPNSQKGHFVGFASRRLLVQTGSRQFTLGKSCETFNQINGFFHEV